VIRHRTANVNEYSARYSEVKDEFYIPDKDQVRKQSVSNKQGRDEVLDEKVVSNLLQRIDWSSKTSYDEYEDYLELGLARELSRIVLPLNVYTEWYWKTDLHNLLHFLRLRLDSHAQYEIRVYAEVMADIVKKWVPLAWEAFEDYVKDSVTLSKQEIQILKKNLKDIDITNADLSKRELEEFWSKLK
jgi:thymidylate synthase (FAD)